MQKKSVLFLILSTLTVFVWYFFIVPRQPVQQVPQSLKTDVDLNASKTDAGLTRHGDPAVIEEEHVNIETGHYRAVLTNKGAAVLSWSVKEKNGQWVNLVSPGSEPVMANFPSSIYKIVSRSEKGIVFEYVSKEGWKVTKTYNLSDLYMHNLNIALVKTKKEVLLPRFELKWGPGIGTDSKEVKENISLTRTLACTKSFPDKIKKLKNSSELADSYKWAAIDNRYFLAAFIPERRGDFDKIISSRLDKKHPYCVILTATVPQESTKKEYSIDFYLGPKNYTYLETYGLGLEKTVDFGFFGFLGKIAFSALLFLHKVTCNYGWDIIVLTIIIQILVLPLTLKSLKSAAAMKRLQPLLKNIQTKYKDDAKRLQAEMLNVYKSQKVNPLGGCLPMLLQLPILWAFFTMLRNAYELRNEGWILWVKDLSAPDQFIRLGHFNLNLLPLIMGLGMFFQQKITAVTSDPAQKKIMYIMPVVFTFMFWSFPSGLVLYWLTNSIVSMAEQYFIIKTDAARVKHS